MKKIVIQSVVLIVASLVIGIVTNGFASRQRRLVLPGYYPNALRVPPRQPDPAPEAAAVAAVVPATTTTSPLATLTPVPSTTAPAPVVPATGTTPTPAPTTSGAPPVPATTTAASPTTSPAVLSPPAVRVPEPSLTERFPPHPDKPYAEISGDDAVWLHGKGALFLDARRSAIFEQGHIAGARSFSVWESDVDEKVNALYGERSDPREQNLPIVIYCSGGACEDSHMLAQKLWGIQFNNALVYKDGFPDWQKRGGATRTGGQP